MLHAVIMAGGSGTRFWPASRDLRPKQLLDLVGGRTMIQSTVDRLAGVVPHDRVLVVTNHRQAAAIAEQLPELPSAAILGEPCKRDTAPCIGLAAVLLSRGDPEAVMAVMPADHVIRPPERFPQALAAAAMLVDETPSRLITFGVRPTFPAETFGYIEWNAPLTSPAAQQLSASGIRSHQVVKFHEKPNVAKAAAYIQGGRCYWNAGIFVWRARTILDALQTHEPEMFRRLQAIGDDWDRPSRAATLEREFTAIRGISIDFAVMERAREVVVIEAPFEWDDLGSWQALARLRGTDAAGNTIVGRHVGVETTNTIVRTDDEHVVATLGVSDLIVVHTPDATLVARRSDEESIRRLAQLLKERGWDKYL